MLNKQHLLARYACCVFVLIISAALALPNVVLASDPNSQSTLPSQEKICGAGVVEINLPKPPSGMQTTMNVTLNDNCKPVYGLVQFQVVEQNPDDYVAGRFSTLVSTLHLERLGLINRPFLHPVNTGDACFTAWLKLYDVIGLLLNGVRSEVCWSWNGAVVTSYSVGGEYEAHREYTPAGPGWTIINPYNSQTGGCVGCANATFRQHAEFSYRGVFDPSGMLHYNAISIDEAITSTGYKNCSFSLSYSNWFSGWWTSTHCG